MSRDIRKVRHLISHEQYILYYGKAQLAVLYVEVTDFDERSIIMKPKKSTRRTLKGIHVKTPFTPTTLRRLRAWAKANKVNIDGKLQVSFFATLPELHRHKLMQTPGKNNNA